MQIAVLVEDQYQVLEVWYPYFRLREEGFETVLVGTGKGAYKSKEGYPADEELSIQNANPEDFDAVVIPGGYAPDRMVRDEDMVNLVKKAVNKCCVIGAICHGPLMLVEADIIKNKKVTGFKSIRTPLKLAGGILMNNKVVTDGNIITAQDAEDVVKFTKAIIVLIKANK